MDILGIGGLELVTILLITVVIAGPKRMIHWSYLLGQYLGKLRALWRSMAEQIQAELDESGVEVNMPKQFPTRATLSHELNRLMTKPATYVAPRSTADTAAVITAVEAATDPTYTVSAGSEAS